MNNDNNYFYCHDASIAINFSFSRNLNSFIVVNIKLIFVHMREHIMVI